MEQTPTPGSEFHLWVNMTVVAESEDKAFDYAMEAMMLAEGQGLMDHRPESISDWSIEGPEDTMYTSCEKCGRMNIEIIDDGGEGAAPEFCEDCDE